MKYLGVLIILTALTLTLLPPSSTLGAHDSSNSRGEKQFSFTPEYMGKSPSHPLAPPDVLKRDEFISPAVPPKANSAKPPSDVSRAQAGQDGRLQTEIGPREKEVQPLQDSETALKQGQSAGQVSNVPGTTTSSPNGTSNYYGTGGIPIFPGDIVSGKTGIRNPPPD